MAKKLYPEESVQAIADSIRSKTGKTDKMTIAEMSGEVDGIDLDKKLMELMDATIESISYRGTGTLNKQYNFNWLKKLVSLTLTANSVVPLSSSQNLPSSLTNIYVPSDLVESYKSATNWTALADYIKEIPS